MEYDIAFALPARARELKSPIVRSFHLRGRIALATPRHPGRGRVNWELYTASEVTPIGNLVITHILESHGCGEIVGAVISLAEATGWSKNPVQG